AERFSEFSVAGGVFCRKPGDASCGFGVIVIEKKRAAAGRERKESRIRMQHMAVEFFELHVCGNIGAERADGVRESGSAEAGRKFLGDCAAADNFAALKHHWAEAALGQVESGDERIVTAADEDYALADGHGQLFSANFSSAGACDGATGLTPEVAEDGVAAFCGPPFWSEPLRASFERADLKPLLQSFKMTWLAMRPGAPMRPRPGCVAEPHM